MDPTYNLNGGFKPTMKRFADLDGPDFFPTPAWATHALLENEHFEGEVWECACGDGAMSRVLESRALPVIIPTRTERHALAQSRRPMGMTRYSLRSENPGMSQPSRGLVSDDRMLLSDPDRRAGEVHEPLLVLVEQPTCRAPGGIAAQRF